MCGRGSGLRCEGIPSWPPVNTRLPRLRLLGELWSVAAPVQLCTHDVVSPFRLLYISGSNKDSVSAVSQCQLGWLHNAVRQERKTEERDVHPSSSTATQPRAPTMSSWSTATRQNWRRSNLLQDKVRCPADQVPRCIHNVDDASARLQISETSRKIDELLYPQAEARPRNLQTRPQPDRQARSGTNHFMASACKPLSSAAEGAKESIKVAVALRSNLGCLLHDSQSL